MVLGICSVRRDSRSRAYITAGAESHVLSLAVMPVLVCVRTVDSSP